MLNLKGPPAGSNRQDMATLAITVGLRFIS